MEAAIWSLYIVFALVERNAIQRQNAWVGAIMLLVSTNKVIRHLGKVLYSTYLIHVPIFAAGIHFYNSYVGVRTQHDMLIAI